MGTAPSPAGVIGATTAGSPPVAPGVDRRIEEPFTRARPVLTDRNRAFWTGGSRGLLMIVRCSDCGLLHHPPQPICRRCHGRRVAPEAVSGRGVVHSFAVSHYQWVPGLNPPYVVARVELVEQPGLHLLTNLVDVAPADVEVGLPVTVCFAVNGTHHIPLFRPDREA